MVVQASRLRQENCRKSERLVWARDPALKSYNQKQNQSQILLKVRSALVGPDVTLPIPGKVGLGPDDRSH